MPVDIDVIAINDIFNTNFSGDRMRALIASAADGEVRVGIDQSRCNMLVRRVENPGPFRYRQVPADLNDLT